MEQFFLDLQSAIATAVRHTMEKIRLKIGEEHIYSAALVTDSDCSSLFLAVNTEEALAERDKEERTPEGLAELRQYYSEELVAQVAEGLFSMNRYLPDEWGYPNREESVLDQVSQMLCKQEETLSAMGDDSYDEVYTQFQAQFLETVTLAFEVLRKEGIFGPEVVCFISMSDDNRALQIEDISARRLNTLEHYEEFRAWTKLFNE